MSADVRGAVLASWFTPQPPEFWQDALEKWRDRPPLMEFWMVYRAWGPEAFLWPQFEGVSDVSWALQGSLPGVEESLRVVEEAFNLACSVEERLFCLGESGFGSMMTFNDEWRPEDRRVVVEFFLRITAGEPALQVAFMKRTDWDEFELLARDVEEADIEAFREAFPRRRARQNANDAMASGDPRLMRVGMALMGSEGGSVAIRVEARRRT